MGNAKPPTTTDMKVLIFLFPRSSPTSELKSLQQRLRKLPTILETTSTFPRDPGQETGVGYCRYDMDDDYDERRHLLQPR